MIKAEDALASIQIYSYPNLKENSDRKKMVSDLKRRSKAYLEKKLATIEDVLKQVKKSQGG